MTAGNRQRALLVVENSTVPRDPRVWPEALSLVSAGWDVTVLAPRLGDRRQPASERLEGVEVRRFELRGGAGAAASWIGEYAQAMWRIRRAVRRLDGRRPFDVIHVANPPDFLLLAALRQRRRGAALIFDQHDLMPEMALQRFGSRGRPIGIVLRWSEWLAHRLADVSIVTNESFKDAALQRGGRRREDVVVVRNGPCLDRFTPLRPDPSLARGREHLLVYAGIMGPLDGVDHAIRALGALRRRRDDWHAILLGDGEALPALRTLCDELGLDDRVEFPGYVTQQQLRRTLCSASVCIAPDPRNAFTDVSTLIKIAEYMAMGRPIVSYDLTESRVTAGQAAAYARDNDPQDMARLLDELLDDPERRARMGREGRRRVEQRFSWERSERALLSAYARAGERAHARR